MNKLIKWLASLFYSKPMEPVVVEAPTPVVVTPTPVQYVSAAPEQSTVVTIPQAVVDDVDASKIKILKGVNISRAKVTKHISDVKFSGHSVTWRGDKRSGWPIKKGKKDTDGEAYLFFLKDGIVSGGEFDALGINQFSKGLENLVVDSKHKGRWGVEPDVGSECYFCEVSWDGSERSNIAKASNTYPKH